MEIRKALESELNGILDLIDEFDRPVSLRPQSQKIESIFRELEAGGGCVIGAFEEGRVIGTCTVNICPNLSWSCRPYAIIENVIVTASHRKRGIGKQLLKFAQDVAEKAGCYKVALATGSKRPETLRFYEESGFEGNKIGFQKRYDA